MSYHPNFKQAHFQMVTKNKGLAGHRGVSLEPSVKFVRVGGPPIVDWSQGLTSDADHYLDAGTSSWTVRTKISQINSASL